MNWKLKVLVLHILSGMPFGNQIHYKRQRHVTKEIPRRPAYLEQLVVTANSVLSELKKHTELDISKSNFVEISAGRDLAVGVAVALRLMHVKQVTCIDIVKPAKPYLIANTARYMTEKPGEYCPKIQAWDDLFTPRAKVVAIPQKQPAFASVG